MFNDRIVAESFESDLLGLLGTYVAVGCYPPPEVLLAIDVAYKKYIASRGDTSLEECFFGKSIQKAGNHSARRAAKSKEWELLGEYLALDSQLSEKKRASQIVDRRKLPCSPESLLKRIRKHLRYEDSIRRMFAAAKEVEKAGNSEN